MIKMHFLICVLLESGKHNLANKHETVILNCLRWLCCSQADSWVIRVFVLCFADNYIVSSNSIKCSFKYEFENLLKSGTQKCFKNFALTCRAILYVYICSF